MKQLFILIILSFSSFSHAQFRGQFKSETDDQLTIQSVGVLQFSDNIKSIYSKPLTDYIKSLVSSDSQWTLVTSDELPLTSSIEDDKEQLKKLMQKNSVQALIGSHITKGPQGITARLILFNGSDAKVLASDSITNFQGFSIDSLKEKYLEMFNSIRNKIPYQGLVLSRKGQAVTINLGSKQKLKEGDDVFVVQVVSLQRHPKFEYAIGNEKFLLGKIRLTKVEENLSFGEIVSEREPSTISVNAKLILDSFTEYGAPIITKNGELLANLDRRKDKKISFGSNPEEWLPKENPQFGALHFLGGLSTFNETSSLTTGGNITASNNYAPNLQVGGEIWLNTDWFVSGFLRQSVFSVENGYSSSSPSALNVSTSQYELLVGYNHYLLDFSGPKLKFSVGLSEFKTSVDSSSPVAMTNMKIGGLFLDFGFEFPVSDDLPLRISADFKWHYSPTVTESGLTSGSVDSSSVNNFIIGGKYKYRTNMYLIGELDLDYYSTNFSGTGTRGDTASSVSQKINLLLFGFEYQL